MILTTNAFAFIIVYGDGSAEKPYRISTCAQLDSWINDSPGTVLFNVNFLITNNLDCTGYTFDNTTTLINSTIDGGNHRITDVSVGGSGLVYLMDNSIIKNLKLEGASGDSSRMQIGFGGSFTKKMQNNSQLDSVRSSLNLTCYGFCGGLVGIAQDSTITKSVFDGDLDAGSYSGGLVGSWTSGSTNNLTISKSAMLGSFKSPSYGGGLIGSYATDVNIIDSYVNGTLDTGGYGGGLIGSFNNQINIINSFSGGNYTSPVYGGGILGGLNNNYVTVTNSFTLLNPYNNNSNIGNAEGAFNSNTLFSNFYYLDQGGSGRCKASSSSTITGCSSMTLSQSDTIATYLGWNLTDTWKQDLGYPPALKVLTDFSDPTGIPNSGDMNNDGQQDTFQGNVELLKNSSGYWTAIETKDSNSCTIGEASLLNTAGIPSYSGYEFASDFVNFNVYCPDTGQSFTTSIYLDRNLDISKAQLLFYNPTSKTYTKISGASFAHQTIGSQTFTVLSYTLSDGGPLDRDGTSNGKIEDPVVLVTPEVSSGGSGGGSSYRSTNRYFGNYSYNSTTDNQSTEDSLALALSQQTSSGSNATKTTNSTNLKSTENTSSKSLSDNIPMISILVITFVSVVALGFGFRKYLFKK